MPDLNFGLVVADDNHAGIVVRISKGPGLAPRVPHIACRFFDPAKREPKAGAWGVTGTVHVASPFYAVVDLPPAVLVGPAFVLPPETAAFLGTPRVLVHRVCCGWNWVDSRESFIATRLNGPCDDFHTPNHELILEQISDPTGKVRQARVEHDWEHVVEALTASDNP